MLTAAAARMCGLTLTAQQAETDRWVPPRLTCHNMGNTKRWSVASDQIGVELLVRIVASGQCRNRARASARIARLRSGVYGFS
jgi:hypothetical protein